MCLLHSRQYVSCIHTGGLSCCAWNCRRRYQERMGYPLPGQDWYLLVRRGTLPFPNRGVPPSFPTRERYPHTRSGWGYQIRGQDGEYQIPGQDGGNPSQVRMGVFHPRKGQEIPSSQVRTGVFHPRSGQWVPPSQVKMEGTPCTDLGWGTPYPGQVPGQDRRRYPQLEQHSVYLLHNGRYVSCVHTGGFSCCACNRSTSSRQSQT